MISFDYEIDDRFVTIGGLFGTKHVIFHIDIKEFRKIIKSLQQLDEEKNKNE